MATLWSAEKVDISAHARTVRKGLLQKRLKEDLCRNVPHVPMATQLVKGLNRTEVNYSTLEPLLVFFFSVFSICCVRCFRLLGPLYGTIEFVVSAVVSDHRVGCVGQLSLLYRPLCQTIEIILPDYRVRCVGPSRPLYGTTEFVVSAVVSDYRGHFAELSSPLCRTIASVV